MFSSDTTTLSRDDFKNIPSQGQQQYSKTDCDYYPAQQNGLARYRSAPSSFFATLLSSDTDNSSSGDDESEAMFSAFLNGPPFDLNQKNDGFCLKQESQVGSGARPGFGNGQMGYGGVVNMGGGSVAGSYGNGSGSGLVRQSSSPAGFLHGYSINGEAGNYKVQTHQEASSSASGLNNHMNYSSGPSSNLSFMPTIPEARNEGDYTPEIRNGANCGELEASAFHHDSMNNGSSFGGLKRNRDGEFKTFGSFNGLENQNGEIGKSSSGLVHHMSLPKTATELASVEKFLQFQQEVVPCQIRAKRGFATHPRSIAERVRRTKISERMNKLQDLFPTMDKQTNKADMLDLAIEYIKDLQKQVQTLNEAKSKCVCSSKHEQ